MPKSFDTIGVRARMRAGISHKNEIGISIGPASAMYSTSVNARNRPAMPVNARPAGERGSARKPSRRHANPSTSPSMRPRISAGDPSLSSGSFHQYWIVTMVMMEKRRNPAILLVKRPATFLVARSVVLDIVANPSTAPTRRYLTAFPDSDRRGGWQPRNALPLFAYSSWVPGNRP